MSNMSDVVEQFSGSKSNIADNMKQCIGESSMRAV